MAKKEQQPTADLAETVEFLSRLPFAETEHLAVIEDGRGLNARSFDRAAVTGVIDWLRPQQGVRNCYYHPNPLNDGVTNRKAKREDVRSARMAHVDIDDIEALPMIAAFPLRPSVVIASGGGFQCLWLFCEEVDDLGRVEGVNKALARRLGGDHCHTVDHLLRLPGTINVPNARKRSRGRVPVLAKLVPEHTDYSRRYNIAELEAVLADDGGSGPPAMAQLRFHTADTLPVRVSEFTLELVKHGDHLARPIGSPGATYPSRSEPVFRVACDLAKAGGDQTLIMGVLLNPENGIAGSILEKPDPERYAQRQAMQALRSAGDGWPSIGKGGFPLPTFANALVALTRLGLRFEFDEFQNRKRINGFPLQESVADLSDDICAAIRHEVLTRFSFDAGKEHVRDAAHTLCIENTVHPLRDYLDGLKWDGTPRIARWLTDYLGASDTALHRTMGELVLMAAVRRVRKPGTKFDTILVLEGPQGSGKSTAVSILASDAYFSDQELLTLDTKSQAEALEGVWFFELGELQGLNRAEIDRVKAFASRQVDRVRPAYARFREDRRRQTIFIGTTNDEQYLRDTTGNRRFWPVRTGQIDLEALRRDRDQIWAEAARMEALGGDLILPEDLWPTVAEVQEERLMDDPWGERLASYRGEAEGGVARGTTADVLGHLEIPPERQSAFAAKRIVPLMRKLGWEGPKSIRTRYGVRRGYERPTGEPDTPIY
jgi:hypothetical protein